MSETFDYAASCGKCGEDFVFGTSKERNDWLREHDPDHYDFCSFFRQARLNHGDPECTGFPAKASRWVSSWVPVGGQEEQR